jgi:hypothetical protein
LNPEQFKIKSGWETLRKYIHYFPNSRFVSYEEGPYNGAVVLVIIDKIKLAEMVKRYVGDFQNVLQSQEIEPAALLIDEKVRLFVKNLDNDGLIGTVLGYGRDNAWLYNKYREMDLPEWPLVAPWSKDEEEALLEQLNKKDLSFQPWDLSDLFYPPFACDPNSEETKQLMQTYREEREKIIKYYEGKDVVEATLSLFNRSLNDPNIK